MLITHSYIGTAIGDYRCLFFLLYEDYIDVQTDLAQNLDPFIERFARDLKESGAVVKPFIGDIEEVRDQVLEKAWSDHEREKIEQTPGLLMMNVDFDTFNPRSHPWLHINLGERLVDEPVPVEEFVATLRRLSRGVTASEGDIFKVAHAALHEIDVSELAGVFKFSPELFGLSIDLREGVNFIRTLIDRLTSPHM